MIQKKHMLIIFGPTGVGKTNFALTVAQHIPAEIINMDMGQLYMPLSIGTAKPDWRNEPVPHHMFDVVDRPDNFSVTQYREQVLPLLEDIWQRGKLPILVGGSGFYLKSLFFPLQVDDVSHDETFVGKSSEQLWQELSEVDPDRAHQIHKNDMYRIQRALAIWHSTGKKPSTYAAPYSPPSDFTLLFLTRGRQELYDRIDARTHIMLKQGWMKEVESLLGTPWEMFLKDKKLIGYNELLDYCNGDRSPENLQKAIGLIQQRTRHYAKRQMTFWRMLEKELTTAIQAQKSDENQSKMELINLTLLNVDLYIKQLLIELSTKAECNK